MIESVATVATDRPARYLKQLVSHLGREVDAEQSEDGQNGALIFCSGGCTLAAEPGTLRMTARAEDVERLAAVEAVVARHLVRFGEKDELVVEWSAAAEVQPGGAEHGELAASEDSAV
ncbi:DUF2218 domain-containing protein [Catenulispora rubra]|uniref:DUF2218 domain-containing protein n=1 Tax=Catenulispora rubra TaxID=280293 RepID=UPI001892873E|nr:DUF2218 domain-containing protein [Catenulispora rubra]